MSSVDEAKEVLFRELNSTLSAYEKANEEATQKALAVKAARNELDVASKNIDTCINRYNKIREAAEILSGKKFDWVVLGNKFKSIDQDPCILADDASPAKEAPLPSYKASALSAKDWPSKPKKALGILDKSLRFSEPEKDEFLRGVVSWYLSPRFGCEFNKIHIAIHTFFPSHEKAKHWLDNIIVTGMKNGIVSKIKRGVYRLKDFSEIRDGGGTYRIISSESQNNFLDVAPGLEDNEKAIATMIMSLSEFSGKNIVGTSVDKKNKTILVEFSK